MLVASVSAALCLVLLYKGGVFSPPNTKASAVRIRVDNRRENVPVESSNRVVWVLIGIAVVSTIFLFIHLS